MRLPTVLCIAAIVAVAGCTDSPAPPAPASIPAAPASIPAAPASIPAAPASTIAGGCGDTPVLRGGMPDWTSTANPGPLPYAMSHEGNLFAGLFGYPLRVNRPANEGSNKILWIAREPREGRPLQISLRRTDGTGPSVTTEQPANSGPGEIYPSIVDVPSPGCWRVTAEWAGHTATLELAYA